MATGLPALTTRHAGIPEAVTDAENGWLVDEHSPEDLAERMLWCARHPDEVARTGLLARQTIERDYALDKRMQLLDNKYAELIEQRHPREAESVDAMLRRPDLATYRC